MGVSNMRNLRQKTPQAAHPHLTDRMAAAKTYPQTSA
jgi:hypothetical protein